MKRVSVIATVHEEKGRASVAGLLEILNRIKPEVIFSEAPPAAVDDYFRGPKRTLESHAVGRFRVFHPVPLVAVDIPTPSSDFFRNSQDLFEIVERMSPEYCDLIDSHRQYVREHGFAYLNSDYCIALFANIHETVLAAIAKSTDNRLAELYGSWTSMEERRDGAMFENIEDYCRKASFNEAAFLVGAAHRQSLVNLSRGQLGSDLPTIQWDFAGFLEAPSGELAE
jgi:hypothetical protein